MPPQLYPLRREDWALNFTDEVFERGRLAAKQGMSRLVRVSPEGVEARFPGSGGRPYQQHIRLSPNGRQWRVSGHCSCPQASLCKHMVAALLTVERLQQLRDPQAMPAASPQPAVERQVSGLPPVPLLRLASHTGSHFDAGSGRMRERTQHRAALSFLYGEHATHGRFSEHFRVRLDSGERLRVARDHDAEAGARRRLAELGLRPSLRRSDALPEDAGELFEMVDERAWLRFTQHDLAALRAAGWQIRISTGFRYRLEPIDACYLRIDELPDGQWFDLEMGIDVAGRRISLLPMLLEMMRQAPNPPHLQSLPERADDELVLLSLPAQAGLEPQRVGLPAGRLRAMLKTLGELYFQAPERPEQALRLHRADIGALAHLAADPLLNRIGGDALQTLVAPVQQWPRDLEPPSGLRASLRPYQRQGLAWLQHLRRIRAGGVLADDMGLGKTLQSLAHILLEKEAGRLASPALVVVPTSLIGNWQDEAERFAPQLRVLALHGPGRRALFAQMEQADVLLTTYALLSRDTRQLGRLHYHLVLLDEAQTIKNPASRTAIAARALRTNQRLCLTGTPLENHLGELWSLFHFLMPGWLGDRTGFNRNYRQPIERHADAGRLAHLNARLRPFILRRSKDQVAPELPPRTVMTRWVELTEQQRDRYETLRVGLDARVRQEVARQGLAASHMLVLEALLRLRQASCDLRLLDDDPTLSTSHSAKLPVLLEMLDALLAEGRRVLVFSQFTSMLGLIEAELQQRGIAYALLTGASRNRSASVRAFQSGALPVFLISLKAGGAGLNLTAADTVIHFDPWWNPAVEAQASDRAHRIGQDKPVFIYRLIARGSVEEKIQKLQRSKAALASAVLAGSTSPSAGLSAEDLDSLLAPLP